MDKEGKMRGGTKALLWIVAIVGAFFLVSSQTNLFQTFGTDQTTDDGSVVLANCQVEDTTLTLSSFDTENKGTATGETHTVFVNGARLGTVADTASTTVSPGDTVDVLYGNNSEVLGGFYPTWSTGNQIACKGTVTLNDYQKDKLSANATLTYFNSDDGLLNQGSDNQSVGSGAEEIGELNIKGASEDYYGETSMIIVLEGASSVYEELKIEQGTAVESPGQHTNGASNNDWAWKVSGLKGSTTGVYDLVIKAKDGQNPSTSNDITVTVYDDSYFIDAGTDTVELGYEDELDNDLGYDNAVLTIGIA